MAETKIIERSDVPPRSRTPTADVPPAERFERMYRAAQSLANRLRFELEEMKRNAGELQSDHFDKT